MTDTPDNTAGPRPGIRDGGAYRASVGVISILGGMLGLAGLYFLAIPPGNKDPLMLALGVVLGWGGSVVGYEFSGAAQNAKTINRLTTPTVGG